MEEVSAPEAWLVCSNWWMYTVSESWTWVAELANSQLQLWLMEQVLPLDTSFLETLRRNWSSMRQLQEFNYRQRDLHNGFRKILMRFFFFSLSYLHHPLTVFSLCSQMLKLPDMTEYVYSFWVGMPYSTQVHILYLACSCPTVETIVVYRDHKWRTPESGMVSYSPLLAYLTVFAAVLKQLKSQCSCNDWILQHVLKTTMQGSGEKKTAWIFRAI